MTRRDYYRLNGLPEPALPEPLAPEPVTDRPASLTQRRCTGCGASIEGRPPKTIWCSEKCRLKARRSNGNGTVSNAAEKSAPDDVDQPEDDEPAEKSARFDALPADDLFELVTTIACTQGVLAITFELESGWLCTVARATD